MIKKLKYIITILLLLIFPLSAIGLNISIHKCKHKGNIHISLFQSSKGHFYCDCCCSVCERNYTIKQQNISCCNKEKEQQNVQVSSDTKMSEGKDKSSNSCCISENEPDYGNSCKESNESEYSYSGINFIISSCCSSSYLSYALNMAFITLDSSKGLLELPILSYNLYPKRNLATIDFDILSVKDIEYPLKEVIVHIISFIHFTSLTGDDSEVPNFLYC